MKKKNYSLLIFYLSISSLVITSRKKDENFPHAEHHYYYLLNFPDEKIQHQNPTRKNGIVPKIKGYGF